MPAIDAEGNRLTLAECRVILERLPYRHPARKAALRDVAVLGRFAREVGREAVALYRQQREAR